MSDEPAKLSNPFSTGGGGHNFENNVQAAFVILMLTGGVVPCLQPLPIKQIKLQGKYAGYDTDDFIVFAESRNGTQKAKLLAQICVQDLLVNYSTSVVFMVSLPENKNENLRLDFIKRLMLWKKKVINGSLLLFVNWQRVTSGMPRANQNEIRMVIST